MKALCWYGKYNVSVQNVPDPAIVQSTDAIVKVTSTAICGSDLHLYDGYIPTMEPGDILGHEFMGEVVEIGRSVKQLKIGDRVVVPFTISCGKCSYCQHQQWSLCDNSNPNVELAEKLYGYSPAGLFGYSHMLGGYAGGQAEYVRVPFADVGPFIIQDGLSDEQVLFLSDILPTAYMAAEQGGIKAGDTVAVWGCGPVGQLVIKCAYALEAAQVIAIDSIPERLHMAAEHGRAKTINFEEGDVYERLRDMTAGRGPDVCIDAVGLEAQGHTVDALIDRAKAAAFLATDRPHVLRQAVYSCRKGGTVSVPGVYGSFVDKFPFGAAFAKGLTMRMGQTHVKRYMSQLFGMIQDKKLDPTFIISHRMKLEDAPLGYEMFHDKREACTKIVLQPH